MHGSGSVFDESAKQTKIRFAESALTDFFETVDLQELGVDHLTADSAETILLDLEKLCFTLSVLRSR